MIEATTNPALRHLVNEAHIRRSLVAWRMIGALSAWPVRLLAGHEKGAARPGRPSRSARCAA